jgi:hypothetical protein
MRRPQKRRPFASQLRAFLLACAVGASIDEALACQCGTIWEPPEAVAHATAVFSGRVVSIRDHVTWWREAWIRVHNWIADQPICGDPETYVRDCGLEVEIVVERSFKGEVGSTVQVRTGRGGGDCSYSFAVGERYLVYAGSFSTGELTTGMCYRTRRLSDAEMDLAFLEAAPERRR